ncbi:hypothetical protein ACNS7O_11635 [Haloferacaceae archaeon DSL9]
MADRKPPIRRDRPRCVAGRGRDASRRALTARRDLTDERIRQEEL